MLLLLQISLWYCGGQQLWITTYAEDQQSQIEHIHTADTLANTSRDTIDVTFIQAGGGLSCNHIWEAKYGYMDENGKFIEGLNQQGISTHHWEQCWSCGQINQEKLGTHKLVYQGAAEQPKNYCQEQVPNLVKMCTDCHYSYVVPKPAHERSGVLETAPDHTTCTEYCKNCGSWMDQASCIDWQGRLLGCGNAGTCIRCGWVYGTEHAYLEIGGYFDRYEMWNQRVQRSLNGVVRCNACKQQFGTVKVDYTRDTGDPQGRTFIVNFQMRLNQGVELEFSSIKEFWYGGQHWGNTRNTWNLLSDDFNVLVEPIRINWGVPNNYSTWYSGDVSLQYTVKSYQNAQQGVDQQCLAAYGEYLEYLKVRPQWRLNGQIQRGFIKFLIHQNTDLLSPTYIKDTVVTTDDRSENKPVNGIAWSTKQTIQASFFDSLISYNNMSTSAQMRLLDKDGEIITDWTPAVRSKYDDTYQNNKFTQKFDILAEIKEAQPVYLECKDQTGNVSERLKVDVQYIDQVAPQSVGSFDTQQAWSKTKNVQYTFTDKGVGNVKVSFNNNSDTYGNEQDIYKLANIQGTDTYTRDYTLTGDVTGQAGVTIYAKDALGNTKEYRATVYNLDNTKPTIEQCTVSQTKLNSEILTTLTVTGENDFCEKIQKNGSGIAGHAIKRVAGTVASKPQNPTAPSENQFEHRNTWNITESGWYFVYAIDYVGNISEPYAIYVEAISEQKDAQLVSVVDATAANGHGGIKLDYQFTGWNLTTTKVWQAQASQTEYPSIVGNSSKWVPVQTVDLNVKQEPIYVINLIPTAGQDIQAAPDLNNPTQNFMRQWTLPEYDWDGKATGKTYTFNLIQYGGLKAWMEGGSVNAIVDNENNLHGAQEYTPYGQQSVTRQQIIRVIPLYTVDVNKNPSKYIWFDQQSKTWKTKVDMHGFYSDTGRVVEVSEIFVGSADVNGDGYDQPQQELLNIIKKFLDTGGQMVAGHDTLAGNRDQYQQTLKQIRDRFKIWTYTDDQDKVPYYGYWGQTDVIVTKTGLMTNFPWELKLGTKLTVPYTHVVGSQSYGTVWMEFDASNLQNGHDDVNFPYRDKIQGNSLYYLTTNNNTAMIQTGHTNGMSTPDEQKIIANTLFYLKQTGGTGKATDNSAQDFAAPNAVGISGVSITNESLSTSKVSITRPLDNGTSYTHVAQQFLKESIADKFALDNGNIGTTNFVQQTVLTGVKGYYYFVDNKPDQKIQLQSGKVQTTTGKQFQENNKNNSSINNSNVIYNKEIQIEYIRETVAQPNGSLESITVDQNSLTDKTVNVQMNQQNIRNELKVNKAYLHIAAYDAAGNIGETTTIEVQLDTITYKPNGASGNDIQQDIAIGVDAQLKGKIYSKDGYRFTGWNTKADGTGIHYDANGTYKFYSQAILYAEWGEILDLTINPNGGAWTDDSGVTVKPGTADESGIDKNPTGNTYKNPVSFKMGNGDKKQIKDPIREGYNFFGWMIR